MAMEKRDGRGFKRPQPEGDGWPQGGASSSNRFKGTAGEGSFSMVQQKMTGARVFEAVQGASWALFKKEQATQKETQERLERQQIRVAEQNEKQMRLLNRLMTRMNRLDRGKKEREEEEDETSPEEEDEEEEVNVNKDDDMKDNEEEGERKRRKGGDDEEEGESSSKKKKAGAPNENNNNNNNQAKRNAAAKSKRGRGK